MLGRLIFGDQERWPSKKLLCLAGYEYGDPYEFNSLQFFPIHNVQHIVKRFTGADPRVCFEEAVRSASIALSFGTLLGEAHYLGKP